MDEDKAPTFLFSSTFNFEKIRNQHHLSPRGAAWASRYGKSQTNENVSQEEKGPTFLFLMLTLLSSPSSPIGIKRIYLDIKKVLALVVVELPSMDRFQLVNDGSAPLLWDIKDK